MQMAQNAGANARAKGAIYGGMVQQAANVPAQIQEEQDKQRKEHLAEMRANATAAYQKAESDRAEAQAGRQSTLDAQASAAYAKTLKDQANAHEIMGAYYTPGGDATTHNLDAGIAKAKELNAPELIPHLQDIHQQELQQANPKPYQTDPTKDTRNPLTNAVITPGVTAPTTAGNEAAIRGLYAKRASGQPLLPNEAAAITGYEAEKGSNDAPLTIKTVENGKNVEKVVPRSQALAAGSYPSQPPASIQVNNALAGAASQPASKAETAMANYMVPTPSPRSFATPAGKAMMDRILTVNPEFDASKYSVRAPTRKAFTTGTQGQQITAMNTAVEHLDQLQGAADALKNGEFKPGNAAYNYLRDQFGSAMPTNYDTIKTMVDKEVEAVANKGVPTVQGTNEQKALANKSASQAQLKGYIDTLIPLMGSKLNALHSQYKQAMGANDPFNVLTPEAQAILVKRGFDPANPTVKGGSGASQFSVGQVVQVNGKTVKITALHPDGTFDGDEVKQ